ncbi:MAG: hypothetical protein KAU31_08715 [Spirochaetaceae bacterium]|nr:hypothetical protein [Spirochaetaceae bacterium]
MNLLEVVLAFLVAMGVISIPLAAIITRKSSPIGQAFAHRIRRRTDAREAKRALKQGLLAAATGNSVPANSESVPADHLEILEAQQNVIGELSEKIDFLQRLIEDQHPPKSS